MEDITSQKRRQNLDKSGLLAEITRSVTLIDQGRKWLDTDGMEHEGRVNYRRGLETAMSLFQKAQVTASKNLELLVRAEYTFISQELMFCDDTDTQAKASLEQAISSFDDALRSLYAVEDYASYKVAEMTYPKGAKYRYKDMPKDAFHTACIAHRTRIGNFLRTPGTNLAEKQLFEQRSSNMASAQSAYLSKQKHALGII